MDRQGCFIFLIILALSACAPGLPEAPASPTTARAEATATTAGVLLPTVTAAASPFPVVTPLPTQTNVPEISTEALNYIDQALQIMQTHSLNRNQVNWIRLQEQVRALAPVAQTPSDTTQAIQFALDSLGDGYSVLIPSEQVQLILRGELDAGQPAPQGSSLEAGRAAYLQLPGLLGSVQAEEAYAIQLQRLIVELDASAPCGWVVDLRQTDTGSMWAMLAGIGPVLGEGLAGAFVYPDGSQRLWYYAMGRSVLDDEVQVGIGDYISYQLHQSNPLAAVLTGPGTIHSGEALAAAFRGRGNARSFGQETAGLVSANQTFVLSDGSWIQLAVALVSDRQGNLYTNPIPPDEYILPDAGGADLTLQAALDWLLRQPDCTGQ